MKVIWKGSWRVAIILLINDREKERTVSGSCAGGINAERRMTDFANHSSFCFEVFGRYDLAILRFLNDALSLLPSIVRSLSSF